MSRKAIVAKRFIIDILNAMCFSSTISWDGDDQFNQLPILNVEESVNGRTEQRGALLGHKKFHYAFKMLVTAIVDRSHKVCYRIVNLDDKIEIDNSVYYPHTGLSFDFSIVDCDLLSDSSSLYYFSDNSESDGEVKLSKLFKFIEFLLNSEFLAYFEDLDWPLEHEFSFPPMVGDKHFKPVYVIAK